MMRLDDAQPFVLLDDARPGGAPARLYRSPQRIVTAHSVADVVLMLAELRAGVTAGLHAVGWLGYPAAAAFEPRAGAPKRDSMPVGWFGLFDTVEMIEASDVPALLPDPGGVWIGDLIPDIDQPRYAAMADDLADLIAAGDLYQANLTFRGTVPAAGHPLALYGALRDRAAAGYGAVIGTGHEWILAFSPELFFALERDQLTVRPMKGTAARGDTPATDRALADTLVSDPKQRAENLMIVDLMRNDLSRIAVPGSVAVPNRFVVETYPTVHQLVSTVTATLLPGHDAIDALAALFPCGSVTGAPKIRAMQVIEQIEQGPPRGPYTGAIGRIDPDGDARFNVAIRTLWRSGEAGPYRIGLGSGYVADSTPDAEWRECLDKAAFLKIERRPFDLIETMAFDPRSGIARIERHLERMKASASLFGFSFDRHAARNELQAASFRLSEPARVRLLLGQSGAIAIDIAPMPSVPLQPVSVAIVPLTADPSDFRLTHKTTDRGFYDDARRKAGSFEVLFARNDGTLTEGSFTSLFVELPDSQLATPPLAGLLPGILRAELIETGRAIERPLFATDLTQGFFIGNALRGLVRAQLVADPAGQG